MSQRVSISAMLFLLLSAGLAHAADKDPNKEQLRRLQAAQQRLTQEKTVLTQQKSELETQVKASEDKLSAAQGAVRQADGRSAALRKDLAALQEEKQQLTTALAEMKSKSEANGQRLEASLKRQEQANASCEAKNALLYTYSNEILARYENGSAGFWDQMARSEPFTRLKQVEVENVLDEYRDKVDSQKIQAPAATEK